MPFALVSERILHYRLDGAQSGTALVFSNSLGSDLRIWDGVVDRLPPDLRIVRYDQRGHGLSDALIRPYTVEELGDDLARLLDQLGVAQAVVCGLSVGGMIAQSIAAARPDLVKALILCDTAHKIGTRESWQARIDQVSKIGLEPLGDEILDRWFSPGYFEGHVAEYRGWQTMLLRTKREGYIATCAALRDADLTEQTSELRVPTLCLCGADDQGTTPDLMRELTALIPGARLEIIDQAGHLPCLEQPEAMAGRISNFIEENRLV